MARVQLLSGAVDRLSCVRFVSQFPGRLQNPATMSVDQDIQREHAYQREHLEKTVSTLKKRLASDNQHHHDDNVRIMQVRCMPQRSSWKDIPEKTV